MARRIFDTKTDIGIILGILFSMFILTPFITGLFGLYHPAKVSEHVDMLTETCYYLDRECVYPPLPEDIMNSPNVVSFDWFICDVNECYEIEEACKNLCIAVLALKQNSSYCDIIEDDYYQTICYWALAAISKDPEKCDIITDEYRREGCLGVVAAELAKDGIIRTDICESIKDNETRESCFWEISYITNEEEHWEILSNITIE